MMCDNVIMYVFYMYAHCTYVWLIYLLSYPNWIELHCILYCIHIAFCEMFVWFFFFGSRKCDVEAERKKSGKRKRCYRIIWRNSNECCFFCCYSFFGIFRIFAQMNHICWFIDVFSFKCGISLFRLFIRRGYILKLIESYVKYITNYFYSFSSVQHIWNFWFPLKCVRADKMCWKEFGESISLLYLRIVNGKYNKMMTMTKTKMKTKCINIRIIHSFRKNMYI